MDFRRPTFNVSQNAHILASDEVDCHTLTTESSRSTNTVNIILTVAGQVVIDDQTDLLDIDTTSPDIG